MTVTYGCDVLTPDLLKRVFEIKDADDDDRHVNNKIYQCDQHCAVMHSAQCSAVQAGVQFWWLRYELAWRLRSLASMLSSVVKNHLRQRRGKFYVKNPMSYNTQTVGFLIIIKTDLKHTDTESLTCY